MENSGRLFEGDVIAPDQYLEIFSRSNSLEPEQELMLAILADAIECIFKYCAEPVPMRAKLFHEAQEWIFAQDDREPFSFLNVCEILNFDPSYLRRGVQAKMHAPLAPVNQQAARPLMKKYGTQPRLRSSTAARSRAGL
jgi:hypothetical protein